MIKITEVNGKPIEEVLPAFLKEYDSPAKAYQALFNKLKTENFEFKYDVVISNYQPQIKIIRKMRIK